MAEEKDAKHPSGWSMAKLIEWSKDSAWPITIDSGADEIKKARSHAIGAYLSGVNNDKKEAMLRVKERVKLNFENGTPMRLLCESYRVKARDVEKWARQEKWDTAKRAEESFDDSFQPAEHEARIVDAEAGIVTREEDDRLPVDVRDMREQKRLMNIRGKQWENVPFEMIPNALRMRMTMLAKRWIEIMERMDDDELSDPSAWKMFKNTAETLEKVAPIPEEASNKPNSLLHVSIFQGDDGLPVKKANAIEAA